MLQPKKMNTKYFYASFCFVCGLALVLSACRSTIHTASTASLHNLQHAPLAKQEIDGMYIEACTQMIRGDYPAAAELFKKVLKDNPENHAANYNLARLMIEQLMFAEAIPYAKDALKGDPANYWYHKTLVEAYEQQGDVANAIEIQKMLIQKFPEQQSESVKLVELYARSQDIGQALSAMETIERKRGKLPELLNRKYQLYLQDGKREEALEVVQELVVMEPDNARYYQIQYDLLQQLGRTPEAIQSLELLLENDPDNGFALLSLADYYKNKNDLNKSDTYLFKAFANPEIPVEGKVEIVNGLLHYLEEDPSLWPRIQNLARLMEETHAQSPMILPVQADVWAYEQQYDSARVYYQKYLEWEPSDTQLWMKLMYASFKARNFRQMQLDAEEALEFYPNNQDFLFLYGLASSRIGEFEPALYALKKINKRPTPDSELLPRVHLELSRIYFRQGEFIEAEKWIKSAVKAQPTPEIHEHYGDVLFELGKTTEAKKQWEEAIKLGSKLDINEKIHP